MKECGEDGSEGVNAKRTRQFVENEQNPLLGLFNDNTLRSMYMGQSGQKVLDKAKFETLQTRHKEEISKHTHAMYS